MAAAKAAEKVTPVEEDQSKINEDVTLDTVPVTKIAGKGVFKRKNYDKDTKQTVYTLSVHHWALIDAAHRARGGVKRWENTVLQVASADNGNKAVVRCLIEWNDGTIVTGIGAADTANTNGKTAVYLDTMAECVPLDTQILARSGFKYHDEIAVGDEVLAYDPVADLCIWTPLLSIHRHAKQPVIRLESRSFRFVTTPNHKWASPRRSADIRHRGGQLLPISEIEGNRAIVIAAEAEGGTSPLLPDEAALLGWLATDGTIRNTPWKNENQEYVYPIGVISQSKPQHLGELRNLVNSRGSMTQDRPAGTRDFGTHISPTLPSYKFSLTSKFTRELLEKAGFSEWSNLPAIVLTLSSESRAAMLDAMLKGDGSKGSASGTWVFGKKAKPGVMEAFRLLATLEGRALGLPGMSSIGEVPLQSLRQNRHCIRRAITVSDAGITDVWCPTTAFGTWVMRQGDMITITGNSRAEARVITKALNVRQLLGEVEIGAGGEINDPKGIISGDDAFMEEAETRVRDVTPPADSGGTAVAKAASKTVAIERPPDEKRGELYDRIMKHAQGEPALRTVASKMGKSSTQYISAQAYEHLAEKLGV